MKQYGINVTGRGDGSRVGWNEAISGHVTLSEENTVPTGWETAFLETETGLTGRV